MAETYKTLLAKVGQKKPEGGLLGPFIIIASAKWGKKEDAPVSKTDLLLLKRDLELTKKHARISSGSVMFVYEGYAFEIKAPNIAKSLMDDVLKYLDEIIKASQ
jgi:hypothetical protein